MTGLRMSKLTSPSSKRGCLPLNWHSVTDCHLVLPLLCYAACCAAQGNPYLEEMKETAKYIARRGRGILARYSRMSAAFCWDCQQGMQFAWARRPDPSMAKLGSAIRASRTRLSLIDITSC